MADKRRVTHRYIVLRRGGGESVTPPDPVFPGTISDLVAADVDSTNVTLTFTPATGATSHQFVYALHGTTSWSAPVSIVTGGNVAGLSPATDYDFKVKGHNSDGDGLWSNIAEAATAVDFDVMVDDGGDVMVDDGGNEMLA